MQHESNRSGEVRLTVHERQALTTQIERFSLLLGNPEAPEPAQVIPASALGKPKHASAYERLLLLEKLLPRLHSCLRGIVNAPNSVLRPEARSLPLSRSKGTPHTLKRLASQPALLAELSLRNGITRNETRQHIQEPIPLPTYETAANLLLVDFVAEFAGECEAHQRLARFCGDESAEQRAEALRTSVQPWQLHPLLRVQRQNAPNNTLLSPGILARCAPPYRLLFDLWNLFHAGLRLDWPHSSPLLFPALEEWQLYEVWCFLRVGAALVRSGWRTAESDCLHFERGGLRLRLAHGRASRIRFAAPRASLASSGSLELFYQPLFPSANRQTAGTIPGLRSCSHTMQPDIALHRNGNVWLLDPKFRAYREPGEEQGDVNKMHTYRDAIVEEGKGRNAEPVVQAAWCLFPGVEGPASRPEIHAYPASTSASPFGTAEVGAIRLRPGTENDTLERLLQFWLT